MVGYVHAYVQEIDIFSRMIAQDNRPLQGDPTGRCAEVQAFRADLDLALLLFCDSCRWWLEVPFDPRLYDTALARLLHSQHALGQATLYRRPGDDDVAAFFRFEGRRTL